MLSVARFEAQMTGQLTPGSLSRALGVGTEAARTIQSRLMREGMISSADRTGATRLVNPFAQSDDHPFKRLRDLVGRFEQVVADDPKSATPAHSSQTDSSASDQAGNLPSDPDASGGTQLRE